MNIVQDDSRHDLLVPADDDFHTPNDHWFFHETAWFWFYVPERKLGGWLYNWVRPNIGTVAGGAWVWDHTAHLPWDVLYSANYSALQLPERADLRDCTLPNGVSIRVVEPTMGYELGYDDGDRLHLALRFEGVMPPEPLAAVGSTFGSAHHYDQFGRVTGTANEESVTGYTANTDRLFLGAAEYTLEEGPSNEWFASSEVTMWALVSVAGAVLFFYRAFNVETPLVDLKPFKSPTFAIGAGLGFVLGGIAGGMAALSTKHAENILLGGSIGVLAGTVGGIAVGFVEGYRKYSASVSAVQQSDGSLALLPSVVGRF